MVEEVKIEGFGCGKCSRVFCGDGALETAVEHEKIPIKKIPAFDGLLAKRNLWPNKIQLPIYTVILDTRKADFSHNELYTWHNYTREDLSEVPPVIFNIPRRVELSIARLLGGTQDELMKKGFPAHGPGGVMWQLYHFQSENCYRIYQDWDNGEFEETAKALKEKYAELYQGVHFKKKVPSPRIRIR